MKDFWYLAFRNLYRNGKRNLATGSAICFGFAGLVMLGAYAYRVDNLIRVQTVYISHTGHVSIYAHNGLEKYAYRPKKFSLKSQDQDWIVEFLKKNKHVDFYEPTLVGSGLIGNGCQSLPFHVQSIDPVVDDKLLSSPEISKWNPDNSIYTKGRALSHFDPSLGPVILSKGLARNLGKDLVYDEVKPNSETVQNNSNVDLSKLDCKSPEALARIRSDANVQFLTSNWHGEMSALDGEMVAQFSTGFDEKDYSAVLMGLEPLQRLLDTDHVSHIAVWLKDPKKISVFIDELKSEMAASGKNFDAIRWNEERLSPYYVGTVQFLNTMVNFIGIVMASIVVLSVMNSTTMTVLERAQEIGMYRSLGFRRRHIHSLYLRETFMICFFSLIVGLLLGLSGVGFVNSLKVLYHPPGAIEGIRLVLVFDSLFAIKSGIMILVLTLLATAWTVFGRLRLRVSELVGGVLR